MIRLRVFATVSGLTTFPVSFISTVAGHYHIAANSHSKCGKYLFIWVISPITQPLKVIISKLLPVYRDAARKNNTVEVLTFY